MSALDVLFGWFKDYYFINSMALEWDPSDDMNLVKWLIAWCMTSPPRADLSSHCNLRVMLIAWPCHDRHVFPAERQDAGCCCCFVFLFQPHGEKCGPLNNWDRQCLPPWCYPRAKKALQCSILILPYWNSRQFMKHFSCLRLWCHQFSGFGSLLLMSFLWKILSQWENVCQNVSAELSFKEWHLIH